MIDALEQLEDFADAKQLRWLPDELPENVRVILSCAAAPIEVGSFDKRL